MNVRALSTVWLPLAFAAATSGENSPPPAQPEPEALVKLSGAEKQAWLEKESPEQKKLRRELVELAKGGQKVAFAGGGTMYVVAPDGSDRKSLGPGGGPRISPDGKKVAFCGGSFRPGVHGVPAEVVAKVLGRAPSAAEMRRLNNSSDCGRNFGRLKNLDGTGEVQFVGPRMPTWSPDGKYLIGDKMLIYDVEKKRLVFTSGAFGGNQHFAQFTPDMKYASVSEGDIIMGRVNADFSGFSDPFRLVAGEACNHEFSRDGKYVIFVRDGSNADIDSWLFYSKVEPGRKLDSKNPYAVDTAMPLPHARGKSVNYYPDFSPCGKYVIYGHAPRVQEGRHGWSMDKELELYVTRFPEGGVAVRITWDGLACHDPHWWGPPAGAGSPG